MNDLLCFEIPINIDLAKDNDEIIASITSAIENNQCKFEPLFKQIIDLGDSRITILDGSLRVTDIVITGDSGFAELYFDSDYYSGCKDMNSTDEHNVRLEFEIYEGMMVFNIELPRAWIIEN